MNTKKYLLFLFTLIAIIIYSLAFFINHKSESDDKIFAASIVTSDCSKITADEIIYLENLGLNNFTSTGITYDSKNDSFWIADHGTSETDSLCLYEFDTDFKKVIRSLNIGKLTVSDGNFQGIAYDYKNDSIWIAIGDSICEVSKLGEVINTISISEFQKYKANGICFDTDGDSLWILCYSSYLLHIDRQGNIIDKIDCNYADQDMIFMLDNEIYITVGADYIGNDNFCMVLDTNTNKFSVKYRFTDSYAIEGIYISNGKMYIVNDGLYHNAKIKKTYISIYNY